MIDDSKENELCEKVKRSKRTVNIARIVLLVGLLSLFVSLPFSFLQAGTLIRFSKGTIETSHLKNQLVTVNSDKNQTSKNYFSDYIIQYKDKITTVDKMELQALQVKIYRYLPDDALIVRAKDSWAQTYQDLNPRVNAVVPFQGAYKISTNVSNISTFNQTQRSVYLVTTFEVQDIPFLIEKAQQIDPSLRVIDQVENRILFETNLGTLSELSYYTGVEYIEKFEKIRPMLMNFNEELANSHSSSQNTSSSVASAVAPSASPSPTPSVPPTPPTPTPPSPKPTPSSTPNNTPVDGKYDDLTGYESGTKIMNFEEAWALGYTGKNQIVAMADTGLDLGEVGPLASDFQGAINKGFYYGLGSHSWGDPMGHGTHVAGSIISRGITSSGQVKGGAYESQIVVQSLWSDYMGGLSVPNINKLMSDAYGEGARVHTNSWGSSKSHGAYDSTAQMVDDFVWKHPDFLVFFAAGNDGVDRDSDGRIDFNSISSPGTAKNIVTVGASENYVSKGGIQKKIGELKSSKDNWPVEPIISSRLSDNADGLAVFSSRGPTNDGRRKPEIVAPGTNILSNRSQVKGIEELWGRYSLYHAWSGGTSMSCPLTAAAGLVTRQIIIEKYKVNEPSAALVKAFMLHTAYDMYPGQYGERPKGQEILTRRPNSEEGYGRVDLHKMVSLGEGTHFDDNVLGIQQDEIKSYELTLTDHQSLIANLTYSDAPGTPSAGQNIVNQIELSVVSPDGKEILANDPKNNNKIIELKDLLAGIYKINVKGIKIPMGKNGKQSYAIVYSSTL